MSEYEVAQLDPIYNEKPETVWINIDNVDGKLNITLQINGNKRLLFSEKPSHCESSEGLILQGHSLTWLLNKGPNEQ